MNCPKNRAINSEPKLSSSCIAKAFSSLLALSTAGVACQAQLVTNGDFESGLSSWTTAGDAQTQASGYGLTPVSGASQALVINDSNNTGALATTIPSAIAALLGLNTTALSTVSTGAAVEGSAIAQQVTVQAGQTLTFNWDFATAATLSTSANNNDYGFLSVAPVGHPELATVVSLDSVRTLSGAGAQSFGFGTSANIKFQSGHSGYQSGQFQFSTGGTYLIGFGVMDVGATATLSAAFGDSGLFVDNVNLTPVPEPKAWAIVAGCSLLGFVFVRRYSGLVLSHGK